MKTLNNKYKFLIFVLVFVIPSLLFLITPGFFGYDSYYYASLVCNPDHNHYQSNGLRSMAEELVFGLLPCSEIFLKLVLIACFSFSLMAIYLIGELAYKGMGFLTVLFSSITNILFTKSFFLENDAFALPFLFFGLFFFLKSRKKLFWIAPCLISTCIGVLLWGGGIYYLWFFSLLNFYLWPVFLYLSYLFGLDLLANLMPQMQIFESNFLLSLMFLMYYVFWIAFVKNYDFFERNLFALLLIVGILSPKLLVLAIPFLALFLVKVFQDFGKKREVLIWYAIIMVLIALLGFLPFDAVKIGPKYYEHQAVLDTIELSQDLNKSFVNDWSLGHLFWFYGAETSFHSGFPNPDYENGEGESVVLSRFPQRAICRMVYEYDWKIDGSNLRLWNC